MKKIVITNMLLFMVFFCFGQNVQDTIEAEATTSVEEKIIIVDDFISLNGRLYLPAAGEGTILYMVSEKNLDRELGTIMERIENQPDDINATTLVYASFWDVGTKLYKIKQVDENNYIAVEWIDNISGNKYYVYCCQKDHSDEKTLKKFYNAMNKE